MSEHTFERWYVEQLKRPERIWVYVQGSVGTWEHASDVCLKYSEAGVTARMVRVSGLDREVGDKDGK